MQIKLLWFTLIENAVFSVISKMLVFLSAFFNRWFQYENKEKLTEWNHENTDKKKQWKSFLLDFI